MVLLIVDENLFQSSNAYCPQHQSEFPLSWHTKLSLHTQLALCELRVLFKATWVL